jgi:hypothetical protein
MLQTQSENRLMTGLRLAVAKTLRWFAVADDRDYSIGKIAAFLGILLGFAIFAHSPHVIFYRADVNLDFDAHYQWSMEFARSFAAGAPYPRWAFEANFGLGEPVFLYYSPLYYFLTALFRLILPSTWAAMQAVEILSTVVMGLMAWLIVKRHVAFPLAVVVSIVIVLLPFQVMLFHYFNGFPWAVAGAFMMAFFWALTRRDGVMQAPNLLAAVFLACLVLTHTVSALICLAALSAIVLVPRPGAGHYLAGVVKNAWGWALTVILGLALSAPYLLPALASMDLINSDVWVENYTPYDAFSFPIFTAMVHGVRWFGFQWPVSLLALLGLVYSVLFLRRGKDGLAPPARPILLAVAGCSVAVFLASELSYPLWVIDTPLRKIQFPHRFIFVGLPLAVIATALLARRRAESGRHGLGALGGLAILGLTGALGGCTDPESGPGRWSEAGFARRRTPALYRAGGISHPAPRRRLARICGRGRLHGRVRGLRHRLFGRRPPAVGHGLADRRAASGERAPAGIRLSHLDRSCG